MTNDEVQGVREQVRGIRKMETDEERRERQNV